MKITEDAVITALKSLGLEATVQKDTNQIYFMLKNENIEFPSFIRPLHDANLLQLMVFIPVNIQGGGISNLARFLHMANKELDMPGFGMDEASQTVFYRVVIPTLDQAIDDSLFLAYVKTCKDVSSTFCSIIQALGVGVMTMDEVFAQLKASTAQSTK